MASSVQETERDANFTPTRKIRLSENLFDHALEVLEVVQEAREPTEESFMVCFALTAKET